MSLEEKIDYVSTSIEKQIKIYVKLCGGLDKIPRDKKEIFENTLHQIDEMNLALRNIDTQIDELVRICKALEELTNIFGGWSDD